MNKTRILIVEDEAIVALDIRRQLTDLGYDPVAHSMRGEEAVALVGQLHPDLVLMDIQLAGEMDGIAVAREIRERLAIPVVFLTAFAGDDTLHRAKLAEPYGYIVKPFEDRELRTVIEMALYKHQAEKNLREGHAALTAIIQDAMDGFYFIDAQGRILEVNEAYCRMTGYSREELLQMSIADLALDETSDQIQGSIANRMQNGFERFERRQRCKDGHVAEIEISPGLIPGDPPRLFGFARDVTERKHLEQQFRQAQKMEAVGQLAGGVAHDFNNILAAILMRLELLKEETGLSDSVRADLNELTAESERAAALTRQLLAFSRRQIFVVKPVDLDVLIRDLFKMLRRLIRENVALDWVCKSPLPLLNADPGMVEQVIMNLCVNARDAMPDGGRITIDAQPVVIRENTAENHPNNPESRPGSYVCLSITDTGCGMDEGVLQHIFEPFFTTKEVGRGTGLGLSTVYGIVKQHQGWIEVESVVGEGTSFHVYFPTLAAVNGGAQNDQTIPAPEGGGETILVVEDEPSVRRLVCMTLERHGYKVLQASNGPEALGIWKQCRANIDLLFTDVVMPEGTNGCELADTFRKDKPELKIILTSGFTEHLSGLNNQPGRSYSVLPKPYVSSALLAVIRASIDQS